jgi:hypothetical protein
MALSTVAVTVQQTYMDSKCLHVLGTVAFGASPGTYAANGLTLALTDPLIKAQRSPLLVRIIGQAKVNAQIQYDYTYVPGTNNSNGLVKIFTGGAEVATGNMPAGVSGDTIQFEAIFLGQN